MRSDRNTNSTSSPDRRTTTSGTIASGNNYTDLPDDEPPGSFAFAVHHHGAGIESLQLDASFDNIQEGDVESGAETDEGGGPPSIFEDSCDDDTSDDDEHHVVSHRHDALLSGTRLFGDEEEGIEEEKQSSSPPPNPSNKRRKGRRSGTMPTVEEDALLLQTLRSFERQRLNREKQQQDVFRKSSPPSEGVVVEPAAAEEEAQTKKSGDSKQHPVTPPRKSKKKKSRTDVAAAATPSSPSSCSTSSSTTTTSSSFSFFKGRSCLVISLILVALILLSIIFVGVYYLLQQQQGDATTTTEDGSGGFTGFTTRAPSPRTAAPTRAPVVEPTVRTTLAPTRTPTAAPTASPTRAPTRFPTQNPTASATKIPTAKPTPFPTGGPTATPTTSPTARPTSSPTAFPTAPPGPIGAWTQLGQNLTTRDNNNTSIIDPKHNWFGAALGLSARGTTVAVGGASRVRVFELNSKAMWIRRGDDLIGENDNDWFGTTLDLSESGNVLAVGARLHDAPTTTSGTVIASRNSRMFNAGQVRVFHWSRQSQQQAAAYAWQPLGQDLLGESAGDQFGAALKLSLDGTTLAVGAAYNDVVAATAGQVRVFRLEQQAEQPPSWQPLGLPLYGEAGGDEFGSALALNRNGTIVAIGAPWHDGNGVSNTGKVRVFQFVPALKLWIGLGQALYGQPARIVAGVGFSSGFGRALDLSADGMTLVTGASQGGSAGQVRVVRYNRVSRQWHQLGQVLEGATVGAVDGFGSTVSLSSAGDVVAVGSTSTVSKPVTYHGGGGGETTGKAPGEGGHVYVFEYDSQTQQWVLLGQSLKGGEEFGKSVELSANGRVLAASTRQTNEENTSGQVQMFGGVPGQPAK